MKEKHLKTLSAKLTPQNWQQKIHEMAIESAHNALFELGAQTTVELAYALLETYFTLIYSASLPFLENDGTLTARIDTLRKIMESCGITFESQILTAETPDHV